MLASGFLQSNEETELMVTACGEAGVQLMDGTMWMHNPRALHMRSVLDDARAVGRLRTVTSSFAFSGCPLPQPTLAGAVAISWAPTDYAHAVMSSSKPCACAACMWLLHSSSPDMVPAQHAGGGWAGQRQ